MGRRGPWLANEGRRSIKRIHIDEEEVKKEMKTKKNKERERRKRKRGK